MNTAPETLRERVRPAVAAPMAARAVGLCEGCPVAKFCVVKAIAPCDTTVQQTAHIESGGEWSGANIDKPVRVSYRDELLSSKPIVMAELQKKKESTPVASAHISVPSRQVAQRSTPKVARSGPASSKTITPAAPRHVRAVTPEKTQGTSDLLADIFVSMLGVGGLATAKTKKSV